jgi:hypothetical protein
MFLLCKKKLFRACGAGGGVEIAWSHRWKICYTKLLDCGMIAVGAEKSTTAKTMYGSHALVARIFIVEQKPFSTFRGFAFCAFSFMIANTFDHSLLDLVLDQCFSPFFGTNQLKTKKK